MNKTMQKIVLKKFAPELVKRFDVDIDGFFITLREKETDRVAKYEVKLVRVD